MMTILLFVQKVQERSWPVSQVWQGWSDECTRYELRVETGDIPLVLSLFRLKSRLDEFLGLLSSLVPIKADARRIMNNSNWKFGNSALLCLLNQRLFSRWSGLLHNAIKHWSWEFGSFQRAIGWQSDFIQSILDLLYRVWLSKQSHLAVKQKTHKSKK